MGEEWVRLLYESALAYLWGKIQGTLSKARLNPFAIPKAAQPVPAKLELKSDGKVSKSKKLATFEFTAQQMNRLEPGIYTFAIEAKAAANSRA